ncbi:DNA ligase D [Bdellovibrio sp. NC01]|uniref:DNA ligase D n=1 Tax=Bdellovibrio sp. NC01 TaxID=2220073 RepID=UPI0011593670|nr:DNA ligase D [Bdellovibrio sp. NC01]QDK37704.1 DNA ligase D [Bdellovibrio sp. NC01]
MALQEYNRKRDFKKTAEPKGVQGKKAKGKAHHLMYVIQEHHASHLHYDFRLEWDGVLKSWAVPKGPSLDPKTKRLAVEVEDHPLSYGKFEGIIPEHEYGGGEVFLWDTGTWIPTKDPVEGLRVGRLEFELKGKKLKGQWVLIRTGRPGRQKQWLLIKRTDAYAEEGHEVVPRSEDKLSIKKKTSRKKAASKPNVKKKPEENHHQQPTFIEPELALLVDKAPEGDQWIHELKFDGYRMQAHLIHSQVQLISRSGKDWTDKFPAVVQALQKLTVDRAIIDGEVVLLDEQGRSDFQLLQNAMKAHKTQAFVYYAFDLLYYSGQDIRGLPLEERKRRLKMILKKAPKNIRYSDEFEGSGKQLLDLACKNKLEGIISKNRKSTYFSGRNSNWVKTKCTEQQEFVIGGYTEGTGSRSHFGALLLGVYKGKDLQYVGKVGTGFTEQSLRDVFKSLKALETNQSPFTKKSPRGKGIHWVKPKLSAEITFAQWTHDEVLRVPVFHGLREDKPTKDIVMEKPVPTKRSSSSKISQPVHAKKSAKGEFDIAISSPDKIIYPKEKLTKMDIAVFYQKIAKHILPYLEDRPLSLVRCPEGADKQCFFQKHIPSPIPETMKAIPITEKSGKKLYTSIFNAQGLTTLVQMGAFEIHVWNSQAENLEHPDQIVMDFDPGPGVSWKEVVTAALELKDLLDHLRLKSFVKLSGSKGLHVHIPVKPIYTWDQIKSFSQALAVQMEQNNPDKYVSKMTKKLRTKKIFVDYLRNGRGATAVVPYSLRARPLSGVALPIEWSDLKKIKAGNEYSLEKAQAYLAKRKKDPWKDYFKSRQRIPVLDASLKGHRNAEVDAEEIHLT